MNKLIRKFKIEGFPTEKEFNSMVFGRQIPDYRDDSFEFGLNPWCVAEGADGEEEIKIKLSQAKKWGLIS